jgi:hypothetical protein
LISWEQRRVSTILCPAKPFLENAMRMLLTCLIGAVGLTIVGFGPPAAAQSLKSVVGTLKRSSIPRMRGGSKTRRGAIGGRMMHVIGATTGKDLSSNGASEAARSLSTGMGGGIRHKSIQTRLTG